MKKSKSESHSSKRFSALGLANRTSREFIASKSPDANTIEDEVAALGADAVADKGMTVFPRNENGEPILYDYQIKGFFKDSCGMLGRIGGKTEIGKKKAVNESGKLTAYKKVIDGLIFIQPRMIPIHVNGEITGVPAPASRTDRAGRAGETSPTASRFQLVRPASLKSFFWTILTRRSCVSGWTTVLCVASASGATAAKAAIPTKSSLNRYGRVGL